MAMAMRTAVAAPRGLRRFFCSNSTQVSPTFPFDSTPPSAGQMAEPSTNLFVSGLNKHITSEKLKEKFSEFGEVVHARVVTDPVSVVYKGSGFVKYSTIEGAAKGIEGMDGKFWDGWVIFAEYATPEIMKDVTGKEEI